MAGGLDGALAQMMHQHANRQALLAQRLERARKDALTATTDLSGLLVDSVNGGVQESFINEKRIELEARALTGTVQRFTKNTTQWLTVFRTFDSALKRVWDTFCQVHSMSVEILQASAVAVDDIQEIGDFENWIKVMEYDCECISNVLRFVASSDRDTVP